MFTLPEPPFKYSALEPHIDAATMEIHHSKHHQAYINKLNDALKGKDDLLSKNVEDLLRDFGSLPDGVKAAVRNHGGGHANHSLFWTVLTPNKTEPGELTKKAVHDVFGDGEAFKAKFAEAAGTRFGSGWAWLVVGKGGKVEVYSTANQDSPLMEGKTPILGLDVWEHAYYLKYQNRRPDYVQAFWNIVNWNEVEKRYKEATS